jgi:hypothetical protein
MRRAIAMVSWSSESCTDNEKNTKMGDCGIEYNHRFTGMALAWPKLPGSQSQWPRPWLQAQFFLGNYYQL